MPRAGIALNNVPLGTILNLPRTDNANAFKLISTNYHFKNANYPENSCVLIHNISEKITAIYSSGTNISAWTTYLNGTWLDRFDVNIKAKLLQVNALNTGKVFLLDYTEASGVSVGGFDYFIDNTSRISGNNAMYQTRTVGSEDIGGPRTTNYAVLENGTIQKRASGEFNSHPLTSIRPCICLKSHLLLNVSANPDGSYSPLGA